jgi:hypothetical protein
MLPARVRIMAETSIVALKEYRRIEVAAPIPHYTLHITRLELSPPEAAPHSLVFDTCDMSEVQLAFSALHQSINQFNACMNVRATAQFITACRDFRERVKPLL